VSLARSIPPAQVPTPGSLDVCPEAGRPRYAPGSRWRPAVAAGGPLIEIVSILLAIFYWLPFMVAAGRDHHLLGPIVISNALFSWTGIGWVVVMAWALLSPAAAPAPARATHLRLVRERT